VDLPRQLFVNPHQVIRLAPAFGKFLLKELIEGLQIVDAPVLPGKRMPLCGRNWAASIWLAVSETSRPNVSRCSSLMEAFRY
jgi:hypothetical protein